METAETKMCTKCEETKSLTDFSKNRSRPDGRHTHCKSCRRAYTRQNKIPARKASARWRSRNPNARLEYRQKNLEKERSARRAHYQKDIAKSRAIARVHQARYRDKDRTRYNALRAARFHKVHRGADSVAEEYRTKILAYDVCCYCGSRCAGVTDHIDAVSVDGDGSWLNLTRACATCNLTKGTRSLLVFLHAKKGEV